MVDIAYDETEEVIKRLEKEIKKVYAQAEKEVEEKLKKHMQGYARKDKIMRKKWQDGEITRERYIEWRMGQLAIGQRWEELRDNLAQDLLNAKKIAERMTGEYSAEVFALNHNYTTFEIEKDSLVDTSYTLYNRDAVIRLVRDNPRMLPKRKVSDRKAFRWYNQKIQSVMTQAILQGESIDKVARRMRTVTDMDTRASIRNARTAMTGAQNAGRHQANMRATSMGIIRREMWVAVMDGRTRHAHRLLDGQFKDVDDVFHSEYGDIRFPGDPYARPENVYNCRCAMITKRAGFEESMRERLEQRRNPALGDMTYEQWKEAKDSDLRKITRENEKKAKEAKKKGK